MTPSHNRSRKQVDELERLARELALTMDYIKIGRKLGIKRSYAWYLLHKRQAKMKGKVTK